jgi:Cu/Ag efflux protein CusF
MLATAAVLAATPALFTACSPRLTTQQSTTAEAMPGVPGGKVTKVTQLNATVTSIDAAKRKVTLVSRNNEKFAVTAGPEVVNFPQIRVGDQLKVSYTEETVVRMARPGEKIVEDATADVSLAEEGRKPGMEITTQGTAVATVTKIDTNSRKVTLQFSDGSSETIKVRDDIDLAKHKAGDKVVIKVTEAYAVKMEKP